MKYIEVYSIRPLLFLTPPFLPQHEKMLSSFLPPVAYQMFLILATLVTLCFSLYKVQTPASPQPKITACFPFNYLPVTLPDPTNKNLRAIYIYEKFCFQYSVVWMFAFFLIVAFQIYESLTSPYGVNSYLFVCGVLSLPYIICPLFLPRSPAELTTPLHSLYSTHCTLFLLIYSFIGNYWYTHYFYSVLNAQYTFVGIRLNDVPVGMYFATVFYFASYHAFSNTVIRYIDVMYKQSFLKTVLGVTVVVSLSYFTGEALPFQYQPRGSNSSATHPPPQ